MTYNVSHRKQSQVDKIKAELALLSERFASVLAWKDDDLHPSDRRILKKAANDVEMARARILGDGM